MDYYLDYIEHVVVADEAFFGTVIRNTHFCSTLHNDNFLHIQFDRWENEAEGERDQRKCLFKNRDHCGRSPTTMTLDYLPVLELSGDLFARKFDDVVEPTIKDHIDKRRDYDEARFKKEEEMLKQMELNKTKGEEVASLPLEEWEFQGEGVLIVAKETVGDEVPLCLGLGPMTGNKVSWCAFGYCLLLFIWYPSSHLIYVISLHQQVLLRPCFKDDVPASLSPKWESGAVIVEETNGFNRWDIGPCSSDGELKRK